MNEFRLPVFVLLLVAMVPAALGSTVKVSADVWGSAQDAGRDGSFETISFPTAIILRRLSNLNLVERGVWEFDLADLPAGNITSVVMQMLVVSGTLEGSPFDVYGYLGNGVIEPGDAEAGNDPAALIGANLTGSVINVDVTDFILAPATLAAGYAGFVARYAGETLDGPPLQKQLQDPGATFRNQSPWLLVEVTPVPLPAAGWLLAAALGCVGLARRKTGLR